MGGIKPAQGGQAGGEKVGGPVLCVVLFLCGPHSGIGTCHEPLLDHHGISKFSERTLLARRKSKREGKSRRRLDGDKGFLLSISGLTSLGQPAE